MEEGGNGPTAQRYKGATAQRRNGTMAQWYKGERRSALMP